MPRRKNLEIRVTIREKDGNHYLRHRDPITGKEQLQLVKGKYESEWIREAGAWERELKDADAKKRADKAARIAKVTNPTWLEFREKIRLDYLSSLAESSAETIKSSLDCIERCMDPIPEKLHDLDSITLSEIQTKLRTTGIADATIASYLRHLKACLVWAESVNMLAVMPNFPKGKRASRGQKMKPMKGRPIRDEEFDLILAAIPNNVPAKSVKKWEYLIKGLWWSGLRLDEAINLDWSRLDAMRVDLDSREYPVLRILSGTEKGGKDRIYPISPEFEILLRETPKKERKGVVFDLITRRTTRNANNEQSTLEYVSKRITRICKAAGVITHVTPARGNRAAKTHYAGAQDFRRTFGTRWARRVLPVVLQQMMRHEDLATTMKYYIELETEDLAADIYEAYAIFLQKRNGGVNRGVATICPHCGKSIVA